MEKRYTVDEIIIAGMDIKPSTVKYNKLGKVKNFAGYAFQLQQLLYKQIKIVRTGPRSSFAKMGKYEFRSNTKLITVANARFTVDEYLDILSKIEFVSSEETANDYKSRLRSYLRNIYVYTVDFDSLMECLKYFNWLFIIPLVVLFAYYCPSILTQVGAGTDDKDVFWQQLLSNETFTSNVVAIFCLSFCIAVNACGAIFLFKILKDIRSAFLARDSAREGDKEVDAEYFSKLGRVLLEKLEKLKQVSLQSKWQTLLFEIVNERYNVCGSDTDTEIKEKLEQDLAYQKKRADELEDKVSKLEKQIKSLSKMESDKRDSVVNLPLSLIGVGIYYSRMNKTDLIRSIANYAKHLNIGGLSESSIHDRLAFLEDIGKAKDVTVDKFVVDIKKF